MKEMTRKQIVEGIATAVKLFGFDKKNPNVPMEDLIVYFGEDDKVTKKEALNYLNKSKEKAA